VSRLATILGFVIAAAAPLAGPSTVWAQATAWKSVTGLFREIIVYGTTKRMSFRPRPDFRLIVSGMTLAR
jgi:hypothetical protein